MALGRGAIQDAVTLLAPLVAARHDDDGGDEVSVSKSIGPASAPLRPASGGRPETFHLTASSGWSDPRRRPVFGRGAPEGPLAFLKARSSLTVRLFLRRHVVRVVERIPSELSTVHTILKHSRVGDSEAYE